MECTARLRVKTPSTTTTNSFPADRSVQLWIPDDAEALPCCVCDDPAGYLTDERRDHATFPREERGFRFDLDPRLRQIEDVKVYLDP